MNIAARTVPLNREGERLVFDVSQGVYRMAYYRIVGKAEKRVAVSRRKLGDALTVVFGEAPGCPHDPDTVEAYMRAMAWGRELP